MQKQLRQFLSYLQQFERVFVKQQIDCQMADKEYEIRQKQALTEQYEKRLLEIDYLFRKTYEDNATGKLSDEQFYRLSEGYEAEQEEIRTEIAKLTEEIGQADTAVHNVEKLIAVTRKYTRVEQLTSEILNALVDKIVVHEAVKTDGKRTQAIDIYYSYVGIIDIPTDEELKQHAGKHGRKTA